MVACRLVNQYYNKDVFFNVAGIFRTTIVKKSSEKLLMKSIF